MDTILRSKEMVEIKLLPVRHHSPSCALHVQRTITAWEPDAIFIEGPDNANEWISVMVHEDTKAPFAVYYSYDDTTGAVSEEKEKYKCYYPFLDYSPELVALREGAKRGIYTAFVDMPYGDILAASQEGKGLLRETEKSNYNDDYLLSRSTYVQMLCEKTGMRSFEEFWEKYFEIDGLQLGSEAWFDNLLQHCRLTREFSQEEDLRAEGCLRREVYMAERILEHIRKRSWMGAKEEATDEQHATAAEPETKPMLTIGQNTQAKILVITGGFHTPALAELLKEEGSDKENATAKKTSTKKNASMGRRVPEKDQSVYMMPYSMEAADALNGYASGMPFAGFYQEVWERECSNLLSEQDRETQSYEQAVLDFIVRCGKAVRSKDGGISTYDEICACNMAQGLAALRGKSQPGAYELRDAVLSSFVKGEYTLATDLPMRELQKQMIGKKVGELCRNANEPPILQDFRQQCKQFGLNITSTIGEEVTLSVFAKKKHREMSRFFHRVDFLKTDFAKRIKGPNLQTGRDRNLMREVWKYKWNTQVMAALIDASVYGGSLEEAILSMVKQELKQEFSAKEGAMLLSRVFEMGLEGQLDAVYERVYALLLQDTDFYSLTAALRTFTMLQELCGLYQSELLLEEMVATCCRKVIGLLPGMTRVKEEDMAETMQALKTIYQVSGRKSIAVLGDLRESFFHTLIQMNEDREIQAGVHGCIQGILYGSGQVDAAGVEGICRGYLAGTREQLMKTALFFRGLFFAAKDLVFVGNQFMEMLDAFLKQVSEEDFMRLLPELRMAFTYFTPGEVDRIAEAAAGMHGKQREDILYKKGVTGDFYAYGKELDAYVAKCLTENVTGT